MKVLFRQDLIEFLEYPFSPSSVCRQPLVSASEIQDVNFGFLPPVIFTRGEFVFIPAKSEDDLVVFAENNNIPHSNCVDILGFVLEPFEDSTDFNKESNEEGYMAYGLTSDNVHKYRRRFRMWQILNLLTGTLWTGWNPSLGLFDALSEASILRVIPFVGTKLFEKTYWDIMEEAKRARLR